MTRDDFTYGGGVGGGAGGGRGADTESAHNFDTYDHNYTSMQVCLQSIRMSWHAADLHFWKFPSCQISYFSVMFCSSDDTRLLSLPQLQMSNANQNSPPRTSPGRSPPSGRTPPTSAANDAASARQALSPQEYGDYPAQPYQYATVNATASPSTDTGLHHITLYYIPLHLFAAAREGAIANSAIDTSFKLLFF